MTAAHTLATARRILAQLRHDRRTVALLFGLPTVLMGMLAWMLVDIPGAFNTWGPWILGIFPLIVMFLITSVATLRERSSGTLERVLLLPVGKGDILGGYALAFGLLGILQALLVCALSFTVFGMQITGSPLLVGLVAVADALLGTALGLAASSLASTEFQAVQMMPLVIFPQLFLCGLIVPRDELPAFLEALSWAMPLSYAIDAVSDAAAGDPGSGYWIAMAVLSGFILGALLLGGLTLRRATR